MKLKKVWHKERTDYYVTCVRPSGRRMEFFLPEVWATEAKAQVVADRKNASRDTSKYGTLIVESRVLAAGWALEGFLPL